MATVNGRQRCPCQCHPDLSWLRVGTDTIHFSDIDGLFVVERRRHFFFLENKHLGEIIPQGQRILLSALAGLPRTRVVVLEWAEGAPATLHVVHPHGRSWERYTTTARLFQLLISNWFDQATAA